MNGLLGFLGGLGLGAGASYLLDPDRGRRRRAMARDKVVSAAHAAADAADTTARDVRQRARGVVAGLRSRLASDEVSDEVLVQRVRSRLGGAVSHPRAIEVRVSGGRVTVSGPVLAHEAGSLLRRMSGVRGVRSVEDRLERHDRPDGVPALQGAPSRRAVGRFEFAQENWSPTARLLAGVGGASLAVAGLRGGSVGGAALVLGGATLLGRAATNLPLRRLLGVGAGRRSVVIQKTIEVGVPVTEAYEFWRRYENFPRFMAHVREVRRSDGRSRWTVAAPARTSIEWETVETTHEPDRLLAWKTVEGAPVAHAGVVRFDATPSGGTRIHIHMSYNPPGGAVGHGIVALLGWDPKAAMDEDLVRLESLLEEGKTRAEGHRVVREAIG